MRLDESNVEPAPGQLISCGDPDYAAAYNEDVWPTRKHYSRVSLTGM
jgi:hypothetical protein